MMAQPSIALIQRGGRCTLWSDKVNQIQALSNQYHLNVGAIIVFDNATWPSVELITESTDNSSYPTWDASLPTTRNINNMSDNDIANHSNGIFLAIFFVPNVYGNTLKDLIHNYTLTSSGKPTQQYVQIAMFFSESTFSLDQDDNNAGGSGNADGNYWDVFTGDHAYIAYLLAAGGALVVALFFFRWCRTSRTGFGSRNDGSMDDEQAIGSGNIPLTESTHKMSLQKLDELCPVQEYRDAQETKNTICAICLEELNLHDMIRVLPCHHGFCVGCIGKIIIGQPQRLVVDSLTFIIVRCLAHQESKYMPHMQIRLRSCSANAAISNRFFKYQCPNHYNSTSNSSTKPLSIDYTCIFQPVSPTMYYTTYIYTYPRLI